MAELGKIVKQKDGSNWKINIGSQTQGLLDRQIKLSADEKETVLKEATQILQNCIEPKKESGSVTGITIGYVQSGKTLSFTTLTALATDNGFRIIIFLAGISNNLLEQTTKRIKEELLTEEENSKYFKVFDNANTKDGDHLRIKNALLSKHNPTILLTVLKKHTRINEITKILSSDEVTNNFRGGVLIIDDEADQASLNTFARKNSKSPDWEEDEYSSTYSSILQLRGALNNHSYIQYTATPQGPLMINIMDLFSPKFHTILTPGKSYTGGKKFFVENDDLIVTIPTSEVFHFKHRNLKDCPLSLINALQQYLMGTAIQINILGNVKQLSMMVHADREKDASKKFYKWVKDMVDSWSDTLREKGTSDPSRIELIKEFKKNYKLITSKLKAPPTFENVLDEVQQVMLDTNIELVISGVEEIKWKAYPSHILVGADLLNRGFTVEGLMISYMPRYSLGISNADTIQQRCRFFGYKAKYLETCRVFLPNDSIFEYREYVEHEELMRKFLKEHSLEELEQMLILSSSLNPTRNNILSNDVVRHKLVGWRQFNALQQIDENIKFVDDFKAKIKFKLFKDYKTPARNHNIAKLEIEEIINFLKEFKLNNMPDTLRKSSTIQYLKYLLDNKKVTHGYIVDMAHSITDGRVRELKDEKGVLKINRIWSGRSTSGSDVYPGDEAIKIEKHINIQLHKVQLKHKSDKWDGLTLYTLGIYYPDNLSLAFTGINSKIKNV